MINLLGRQATLEELGAKLSHALAEATLISRAEAARRITEAAELGPRHGLTGEPWRRCSPTPPPPSATAASGAGRWR